MSKCPGEGGRTRAEELQLTAAPSLFKGINAKMSAILSATLWRIISRLTRLITFGRIIMVSISSAFLGNTSYKGQCAYTGTCAWVKSVPLSLTPPTFKCWPHTRIVSFHSWYEMLVVSEEPSGFSCASLCRMCFRKWDLLRLFPKYQLKSVSCTQLFCHHLSSFSQSGNWIHKVFTGILRATLSSFLSLLSRKQ